MHLIETTPAPCVVCGKGKTANAHGESPRFVDFERDVNWNDPLVMCEDCVAQAGGMVGMASSDLIEALKHDKRELEKVIHELNARLDTMKKRARKLGIQFTEAAA